MSWKNYSEEQVTQAIYQYVVEQQPAQAICEKTLGMNRSRIRNSSQAWRDLPHRDFGMKKYKALTQLSYGQIKGFVGKYWDRGGASENQMLDYFPNIKDDYLREAEEKGEKVLTGGTNKGTGISRKNHDNFDFKFKNPFVERDIVEEDDDFKSEQSREYQRSTVDEIDDMLRRGRGDIDDEEVINRGSYNPGVGEGLLSLLVLIGFIYLAHKFGLLGLIKGFFGLCWSIVKWCFGLF